MNPPVSVGKIVALSMFWLLGCNVPANSETMTWTFQNVTRAPFLGATLYSRSRAAAWPGNNQAYSIPNDGRIYGVPIACLRDEIVCHGAWVPDRPNISWGVGPWNQDGCPNCCANCREGTTIGANFDRSGCKVRQASRSLTPLDLPKVMLTAATAMIVAQHETCDDIELPPEKRTPTGTSRPDCKNETGPSFCDLPNSQPIPSR